MEKYIYTEKSTNKNNKKYLADIHNINKNNKNNEKCSTSTENINKKNEIYPIYTQNPLLHDNNNPNGCKLSVLGKYLIYDYPLATLKCINTSEVKKVSRYRKNYY